MSALLVLLALAVAALVHRRFLGWFGAGIPQHLVRLPGNFVHEAAHAVVMVATGYSLRGFTVSLFDRAGRGHVQPGPPWIGLARPWFTNLLSPIAPAVAGLALLGVLAQWSGAPGIPTSVAAVLPVLRAVPYETWQLWVGLALAFSVTAEMAPSDVDLGVWWRPALVAAGVGAAALFGVEQLSPGAPLALALQADDWLRAPMARALAMAVWSGVVVAPVAMLIRRLRG